MRIGSTIDCDQRSIGNPTSWAMLKYPLYQRSSCYIKHFILSVKYWSTSSYEPVRAKEQHKCDRSRLARLFSRSIKVWSSLRTAQQWRVVGNLTDLFVDATIRWIFGNRSHLLSVTDWLLHSSRSSSQTVSCLCRSFLSDSSSTKVAVGCLTVSSV